MSLVYVNDVPAPKSSPVRKVADFAACAKPLGGLRMHETWPMATLATGDLWSILMVVSGVLCI